MRDLTKEERKFLEYIRDNHYKNRSEGYVYFRDKKTKKKYKRSRVLMQLHLNKKLEIWEVVHHKDRNKENDLIENLEVKDTSEHSSYHYAGMRGRKNKPRRKSNKLNEEIINKIFRLHRKGKNYSVIARELGISDFTIARYIKNHF